MRLKELRKTITAIITVDIITTIITKKKSLKMIKGTIRM
jgi:hypothetical protein